MMAKKRQALVGFSTPLGYDYATEGMPLAPDKGHPILEAPTGLLILYDDIWFAHEDVCPVNLRDKEFVHFIQDEDKQPNLRDLDVQQYSDVRFDYDDWSFDYLKQVIEANVVPGSNYDNHNRGVEFLGIRATPAPNYQLNVSIDSYVGAFYGLDFVINTATSRALDSRARATLDPTFKSNYVVEHVVSHSIPCYQSKEGPYIEYIDDLRASPYIKAFREKVQETVIAKPDEGPSELSQDIIHEFREFNTKCRRGLTNTQCLFCSSALKLAIGALEVIPFVSTVSKVITVIGTMRKVEEGMRHRWTEFVAEVEKLEERQNYPSRDKRLII